MALSDQRLASAPPLSALSQQERQHAEGVEASSADCFAAFFLVVLTLIVLFALISYSYVARALTQTATDFMLAQAESIAFQTDTILQDANELSGKLLFSQELLELFYSDMFETTSDSVQKRHRFDTLVYSIGGPQFPPFQINMFRLSGEFAGVGSTGVITRQPPAASRRHSLAARMCPARRRKTDCASPPR